MNRKLLLPLCCLLLALLLGKALAAQPRPEKSAVLSPETPEPKRFVVRNNRLIDLKKPDKPVFFKGMGYSPYLPGESPLHNHQPGNDSRYALHLSKMRSLGVNYLHVFPRQMPAGFFTALDQEDLLYGQDIWVSPYESDYLDPSYLDRQTAIIKSVIDHNYAVGRPDRLVLFSIGDELRPASITATNAAHPKVTSFRGKYVQVQHRNPSEVAMAMLIDRALDYELTRYGQRHLYCHTSFTHVGPITDRPDLEVRPEDAMLPDMGDLICLNIYTYANAVRSSGPGRTTKTSYQGYLEQLAWETHKPILIGQVGFSTSPIAPKPEVPGFGGHKVEEVAKHIVQVWRDLRTAQEADQFCGLAFFEWQDEWWKSGETQDDAQHHAPEDPEEWFGIYGLGPEGSLEAKGPIPEAVRQIFLEEHHAK